MSNCDKPKMFTEYWVLYRVDFLGKGSYVSAVIKKLAKNNSFPGNYVPARAFR